MYVHSVICNDLIRLETLYVSSTFINLIEKTLSKDFRKAFWVKTDHKKKNLQKAD